MNGIGTGPVYPSAPPRRLVAGLLLAATLGWSQPAAAKAPPQPLLPYTQFILDNGLTLIVREDHKLPIVSVEVVYAVGSRDDPPGKSGLAHLFEHLLFYGSQHHPHNFLVTMQGLGGTNVNGGAGPDLTTVYQTVPVSQLDAVLWLESDRMGYLLPALSQETLDDQIEVVRNEIAMGRDEPGGDARFRISAGVFPPDHPYHREPVGDPRELGNVTLDDARQFFETYYAPSNAAIVLAGDITPSEALAKVKQYFGGLPSGPRPGRVTAWVPQLHQDKRERIFDAAPPRLYLAWPMPGFGTIDDVQLRLAGSVLMDGDSSRVRRRLRAAGLDAVDLSWYAGANAMAGVFGIVADAPSAAELRTIERIVRDEVALLAEEAPTRAELERAQRTRFLTLRRLAQSTAGSNGQADLLAHNWGLGDRDVGLLDANMRLMFAAKPEDVSAAARRWLHGPAHVLDLVPTEQYVAAPADVDRNRIPPAAAFKPADFPDLQSGTLPNGLKTRHVRWRGGPVVVVSLIVRGGAAVDPPEQQGLGRLTASLLTAGAGKLSESELADALARLDASLTATIDLDAVTLNLVVPGERTKEALDLLGTVVAAPSFPVAAVEREKRKQVQTLQNIPNEARLLSRATVRRLAYGTGAPYGAQEDGLGAVSGLNGITAADVADYHRRWFHPANSELVVVGDIGRAEAEAALQGSLGRWHGSGPKAPAVTVPDRAAAPGVYLIDRPGMEQADLSVATLLQAPASTESPVNEVLTKILGDSVAGRINQDLREQKQWAYWAIGYVEGGSAGQIMLLRTQVQSRRTAEAMAAIRGHLEDLKGGRPVSPEELQLAKDVLTLSLPLAWESDEGIAQAVTTSIRRGLPDGAIERYVTDVRAVTAEQVEEAARRMLQPEGIIWLVIGDRSKVEPQLVQAGIDYELLTPEP